MSIFEELMDKFNLDKKTLEDFIQTAPNRYKFHSITKRHGGTREIAQPIKSLKIIQRWLIKHYLVKYPVHHTSIAYAKNKNIKNFALPHQSNAYLLKLDFKNFFNSIEISDFYKFCQKSQISEEDGHILGLLLFCKNKIQDCYYLSIGAPSSPILSNILMFEFDNRVFDYCKDNSIIYTRYADDLAFSTNKPYILASQLLPFIISLLPTLSYP